ncbi:large exoprotein [Microbacterium sp. P04]|uniref:large exoprotein n=1 Tax=Microbacterium sp. P04 TaxID=3366947 RepID=UPI003745C29B
MGGQVWGGGVIVLVAVVLWLVYLLPSWHSRHLYTSAERNAVRLNQALRVLAETSETPREVHLELTARTALAQQKLARRAQEEREQAELAIARAQLEVEKEQTAADREAALAEIAAARETARAEAAAARRKARAEAVAARAAQAAERAEPNARRARTRRAFRLTTTLIAVAALVMTGVGVWQTAVGASAALVWAGATVTVICGLVLQRLARVAARTSVHAVAVPVERVSSAVQDVDLPAERVTSWTPRELPRALVSSAGSRAAAVLDQQAAREALRAAAREQALREIAEQQAPPSIDTARVARASKYEGMGYVDDAEIEAHVRQMLARRAVG